MLRAAFVAASGAACGAALGLRSLGQESREGTLKSSTKSVYDAPSVPTVLEQREIPFQRDFGRLLRTLRHGQEGISSGIRETVHEWINAERRAEDHLGQLVSKDESLQPAVLSVGIATLLGSILTRNRGLLLRIVTPSALLIASSSFLLPVTTHNIAGDLHRLLEHHSPASATFVNNLAGSIADTKAQASATTVLMQSKLGRTVEDLHSRVSKASQGNVDVKPTSDRSR